MGSSVFAAGWRIALGALVASAANAGCKACVRMKSTPRTTRKRRYFEWCIACEPPLKLHVPLLLYRRPYLLLWLQHFMVIFPDYGKAGAGWIIRNASSP
jgi:hypothetical protein